jgi:AsmA-like C-terminal region
VLTGTTQEGMALSRMEDSGDLHFTQLRIPFRQEGWVIQIDDAALRGPTLGATASGTINLPDGKMAISGAFIPAFGLNNIAGAIPIIGAILGGGRDEGLLGITYKLFGPLDSPELAVNPISAIAPGIFRKIFEYR